MERLQNRAGLQPFFWRVSGVKKRKTGLLERKERRAAYLFLTPMMFGILIFYIYAFGMNILFSFTDKSSFGTPEFVGLKNYITLFQKPEFYSALKNTFLYVVICVPVIVVSALVLAVLLDTKIRGRGIYRTLIVLPIVTMPVAVALVWKWIFNYEFGLVNLFLHAVGRESVAWITDPGVSLFTVCIVVIWSSIGQPLIIFLAGLQGISRSYYEAAQMDGASALHRFFSITLPLLSPTTFMVLIMQIIGFFQIFDLIYMMIPISSMGMKGARSIVVMYYEESFVKYNQGYGAAVSIILFVIILVITLFQMKLQNTWVNYD
jgi:multiple sugar transport system permease protein